jgi:hypothetical protein
MLNTPRLLKISLGLLLVSAALSQSASAAINSGDALYIDFGRNEVGAPGSGSNGVIMPTNGTMNTGAGNSTGVADGFGHYWNNAWMNTANVNGNTPASVTNLITSANVGTGINLSFSNGWQSNGFNNGGLVNPSSSLLGDFASTNATGDYFFFNHSDPLAPASVSMTFTGLDISLSYNFKIFATRDTMEVRKSQYSITDVNGLHTFTLQTSGAGIGAGGANGNNNTFATFTNIVPGPGGTITLSLTNAATSGFAYVGALQLTAVPEPGSVGVMFAIGCAGLVVLHRRKQAKAKA